MDIFRCYLIKFNLSINESNCVIVEGPWGDVRKCGPLRPAAACDDPRNRNRNLRQGTVYTLYKCTGVRVCVGGGVIRQYIFCAYVRWISLLSVFKNQLRFSTLSYT
jgi:hypothetical protein